MQPPKTAHRRTRSTFTSNTATPTTTFRRFGVGVAAVAVILGTAAPALAINPGGGRHRIEVERAAGSLQHVHHGKATAKAADDSYLDQELFKLRMCESHNNYRENTGNGYYGAYQFALQTWEDLGMTGRPDQATPDMQDYAAKVLHARAGWGPWPACAAKEGLN